MSVTWQGVFPAATTQFRSDESIDIPATLAHLDAMIEAGIDGLIMLGTACEELLARSRSRSVSVQGRRQPCGWACPRCSLEWPSTPRRWLAGSPPTHL